MPNTALAFANPVFGPDGSMDARLVWQRPLRSDEPGHWGVPLTVTADGRIYGHLATRGRCHGGFPDRCVNLDSLDPSYTFDEFLTGEAIPGVRTGPIVLNTTHSVRADGTIRDWDWLADTGDAVADVNVGVDQHGVWVAGMTRRGITDQQLAALRGSALSGEWTPSPGRLGLRLSGILAVNSPGFTVARRPVAAAGGLVYTFGPDCGCGGDIKPVDPPANTMTSEEADAIAASLLAVDKPAMTLADALRRVRATRHHS